MRMGRGKVSQNTVVNNHIDDSQKKSLKARLKQAIAKKSHTRTKTKVEVSQSVVQQ